MDTNIQLDRPLIKRHGLQLIKGNRRSAPDAIAETILEVNRMKIFHAWVNRGIEERNIARTFEIPREVVERVLVEAVRDALTLKRAA